MKIQSLLLIIFTFISNVVHAANEQGGQFKNFKNWQVHYSVFPSSFLQPKIANHYGIIRSDYHAVVNISVLAKENKAAKKVLISGTATNLVGQTKSLTFTEIVDGDAIYYIANIKYSNEETLRFKLNIKTPKIHEQLSFKKTLYVN